MLDLAVVCDEFDLGRASRGYYLHGIIAVDGYIESSSIILSSMLDLFLAPVILYSVCITAV